jgi:two-component system cell cycle sensor histidine kinase/response regulator CckA
VVFDVVFGGPGPEAEADAGFAEAIRESGRVILAGQANAAAGHAPDPRQPWGRWLEVEPPGELFASAAAAWGVANHRVDDDFVVRRHLAGVGSEPQASLTWAAADWLRLPVTRGADAAAVANRRWIRYYGPALSIPAVSYTQALRADGVPSEFFRDRIVFVGARPMAGLFHERQDEFRNPFHSWRHKERFMPGVEVHATAFLNLLRGDALRRASSAVESLIVVGVAAVAGMAFVRLRPAPATVGAVVGAGAVFLGARTAFGNGTWFPWLVVAGAQIPAVLFGSWLHHFRDWYSTRRRLEAERRAAEARIREQAALIDKANDAILVEDLAGRVVYANPSAERLYGWTLAELREGTLADIEVDPGGPAEARAATLGNGEWRGELRQRDRRGRELLVESRWTLIRDDRGAPRSLLRIHTDATEKRQLEAESLRLQRAEAVGALASGMAHDLNNALAPVLMGAQLLARAATDDETRRILHLMESATRRGADMVRQVLLFARGRQGERRCLDLGPLVKEMEKLVRDTFPQGIQVAADVASDLWPVQGNPTELHQVLLNLCVNARDAMPGGGWLNLVLDNVELDGGGAAAIPGGRPGRFVSLLVADSGSGIPPEVLPRIFEPFFSTKPAGAGTGLGLSTTARIIRAHGGFVTVTSQPGEGTSFEIFLPRHDGAVATDPDGPGDPVPRGRGERLLVADDDVAVAEMLRRGLEDHGYRVVLAGSGVEAVARFQADSGSIALVLCDVSMPGLDGPGVGVEVRRHRPEVPVFLMGGDGESGAVAGDRGAGSHFVYLAKPFVLSVLLRSIRQALDRNRSDGVGEVRG